jgi:hypothetical protein
MALRRRRSIDQLHDTIRHTLLHENAGGATQHRPHLLQNDEGSVKNHVGRNILSYVQYIVVAIKRKASYIPDLTETFVNMCEAKLKLNPKKCVIRVT